MQNGRLKPSATFMDLKIVNDKKKWNEFVQKHAPRSGAFLHSWEWVKFQDGRPIGMYQKDKLEAVTHLIKTALPGKKKYLYCPRGPLSSNLWYVGDLIEVIAKELPAAQEAMFIRFDPAIEGSGKMSGHGFRATATVQPKRTLMLDLSKEPERLLAEMHHKTRYNIRLAAKKDLVIEVLDPDQFDQVWPVFEETAQRDKFRLHDQDYYQQMLNSLGSLGRLVVAKSKGQIIAATIMIDFAGVRTYLHGASSNEHRNLMAPYAIHWHEIQNAIKQGYKYYDFWGISKTNPDWKGITRFKKGFTGFEINYPGTFDYPLNKGQYLLYRLVRRLRYGSRH